MSFNILKTRRLTPGKDERLRLMRSVIENSNEDGNEKHFHGSSTPHEVKLFLTPKFMTSLALPSLLEITNEPMMTSN